MYAPLFSVESQYLGAEKTERHQYQILVMWRERLTCDAFAVVFDFVTLHSHFMASDDRVKAIVVAEPLRHIRAKLEADSSLAWAATGLGLRIRPEHFHHEALLARLPLGMSIELSDVV